MKKLLIVPLLMAVVLLAGCQEDASTATTPRPGLTASPGPGMMSSPASGMMVTPGPELTSSPGPGMMATPGPGMMGTVAPRQTSTPGPGATALSGAAGASVANGERIYREATSDSGQEIEYRFDGAPMMGLMHPVACADCHGPQGHGGRVTFMMQSFEVPNITWHELTEGEHTENGHEQGQGEAGHPPYTEETVKRAITEGLNPAGEELDPLMPRWSMSRQDLYDLVEFLKTLE